MHIRLLAFGSRGDVQPYVALGLGLQAAGYDVALAAAANFQGFIEEYGLKCLPMTTDIQEVIQSTQQGKSGSARQAKWIFLQMMMDETLRLAEGADALIYAPAAIFTAPHVLEKLGIPGIATMLQPFLHAMDEMPAVGTPTWNLGTAYNRFTYSFVEWMTWTFTKGRINDWRKAKLGLPPATQSPYAMVRAQGMPTLYGFSPAVLPKPADWPANAHVTGYWFLPPVTGWQPPAALEAFLAAGDAPVYVGFGSMASRDPEQTAAIVLEAIQQAGVRAVIASGWGGLAASDVPETVHLIEGAPHEWLFPRMSAVVHHGGAGTTAAGLRAGVPTVIVPFKSDQPFWGKRVWQLGVGTEPIPRRTLTAEALAAALRATQTNDDMREKAAAMGEAIRAEDGIGAAVRVIGAALGS
ncbi:MAG: glycosyltransferase family 1 protein [Anaerolineae bacterium]|nr:glycosyltransferase family 1 protein [Anaerolineae bacterium]